MVSDHAVVNRTVLVTGCELMEVAVGKDLHSVSDAQSGPRKLHQLPWRLLKVQSEVAAQIYRI